MSDNKQLNEGLLAIAKDAYLIWCDFYNRNVWYSYPLWAHLSEKEKTWWVNYVKEIHYRYSNAKMI